VEHSCISFTFPTEIPCLPYDGSERQNGYAWYYRPSVEDEWLIAARDGPILTMVVLYGLC
jgi:hypothetical protein